MYFKLLSIAVPSYNVEHYLESCLASFCGKQGIPDSRIEVIVVNDGSSDRTSEIAHSYESSWGDCLVVVDKENGGHGSAVNAGLQHSSGKYFKVVDADDWVNAEELGILLDKLDKVDSDVVLTDFTQRFVQDGTSKHWNFVESIRTEIIGDYLDALEKCYFPMHATAYRADLLKKQNFHLDEGLFYVDKEYLIIPIAYASSYIYFDLDFYQYRCGRAGQSMDPVSLVKNRWMHKAIISSLLEFAEEHRGKVDERRMSLIDAKVAEMIGMQEMLLLMEKDSVAAKNELIEFDTNIKTNHPEIYKTNQSLVVKLLRNFKFHTYGIASKIVHLRFARSAWRTDA